MINRNCAGCDEEWHMSFECQECGLHLATLKDRPDFRKHFFCLMVDDEGRIMVG